MTLDDVMRTLDELHASPIADTLGSVAIAGVMGGQRARSATARNILLNRPPSRGHQQPAHRAEAQSSSAPPATALHGVPATLNDTAAPRHVDLMRRYAGAIGTGHSRRLSRCHSAA